jgi:hypothetical protein
MLTPGSGKAVKPDGMLVEIQGAQAIVPYIEQAKAKVKSDSTSTRLRLRLSSSLIWAQPEP